MNIVKEILACTNQMIVVSIYDSSRANGVEGLVISLRKITEKEELVYNDQIISYEELEDSVIPENLLARKIYEGRLEFEKLKESLS